MVLVTHDTVGPVAFSRMRAAGVVILVTPDAALPADVTITPVWRALALRAHVPSHTVLSGLAGLWVRHGGCSPAQVIVVGRRGLHRTVPPTEGNAPAAVFHSGRAHAESGDTIAGVRTAAAARCAVDALRWDDHRYALPAVVDAVRTDRVSPAQMSDLIAGESSVGAGYARLESAWRALRPMLDGRALAEDTDD